MESTDTITAIATPSGRGGVGIVRVSGPKCLEIADKILKKTQRLFGITIRHGTLYPLLNRLEKDGYVRSQKIGNRGRIRKVYDITTKGTQLVDAYYNFLKEQLSKMDIEEA